MADLLERLTTALADRYRVDREIGRGGMAHVFLARDLKLDRPVAVKVLRPDFAASLGTERFLREITLAAKLEHPHILAIHDSGEADGLLYYVMPYVEGESLRQRLEREKQLSVDEALQISREVADALSCAHSRGVIHRDIKPENILLQSGHAVVADFGIARAVTAAGGAKLTETGLAIGTPAYMSPEQAAGSADLDGRSDLYSLGCVLFEMLSGETPYTGPTPQAILAKKLNEPLPHISVVRKTVPAEMEVALTRALARVPADRFPTAGQFAEALTRTAGTEVDATRPAPRAARRWRRPATAALAVVLLGVAAWMGWQTTHADGTARIRSLAVLPLQNLSGDTAQDYFVLGIFDALIGELNHITALRVTSRTSAMSYADTRRSVPEIARELNVDAVVEGSVLHAGDSVRIRLELIRARPQEHNVWGDTYDRNTRDILGLYSDIARAVAREVQATLTPAEATRFASARRVNPATYQAYLRGMYLLQKANPEDNERGLAYMRQAIEEDPADPLAYAGLAEAYITTAHGPAPQLDAFPAAQEAAERALRLDPTLTETLASLGFLRGYWYWEWDVSDSLFRRAIELNPSSVWGHYWYAWQLHLFGMDDSALAEHKRAEAADPLNAYVIAWTGQLYYAEQRYDEAMASVQRALALNPNMPVAHLVAAEVHLAQGRNEAAMTEARQAVAPDSSWLWVLGYIAGFAGHHDEARSVAARLERQPTDPWTAFGRAAVYASLGDKDQAFRWLNYPHPHCWVPWVRVEPWFSKLRDDPRLPPLLEKFHLPPRVPSG